MKNKKKNASSDELCSVPNYTAWRVVALFLLMGAVVLYHILT